ncbi:MAG: hypothetical protein LVQ95_05350 [Candidatus Micrarchaeales archaeon]|nr:hypothetical protein [Candidatus Micrarchaeales archaeon]
MNYINGNRKGQSAIEYLMTYGWAIIIIVIVLAVLYLFNVFNPSGYVGNTCSPNAKFLCQLPAINATGALSFEFAQTSGNTEYNLAFACTQATNLTTGEPFANMTSPWEYANLSGNVSAVQPIPSKSLSLDSGTISTIRNLQCYDVNGNPLGTSLAPLPIGTQINGKVWVEYTDGPGANSISNPYLISQVGTISVQIGSAR